MTWYRSLYWRIAAGFIACLAALLIVQGVLFVWVMTTAGPTVPNQPPERFAQTVAFDIAQALERDPSLDVDAYLRQEYARDSQPFVVLLVDGRTLEIGARFPDGVKNEGRARLDALKSVDPGRLAMGGGPYGRGPFGGRDDGTQFGGRGLRPQPGFGRGGPGFRGGRPGLIVVDARVAGLVVVPGQPPFTFLLTRYAPTLVTVAAATLIVGGVLAAFVVFGPARRRLRDVEDAARRLGAGDLSARAPASGNDEVTAVARAFNAMATDLQARTDALMDADRARRQLLADISHELNTPVTAMRGYLETLSMPELALDEATRIRYLKIVGDETGRLERIIGDLLDLARVEGGGASFHLEQLQVQDLFARVLARHEQAARTARVRLESSVGAGAESIAGDRTRLEQAVQNLAANALRHAPPDSAVRLDAIDEAGSVTLRVADMGPGIPAEHLAHVFDRFYKVDGSRAAQAGDASGSGLGLSIVKAIVERHGARIRVESAPGRTVFVIEGLAKELRTSSTSV